MKTLKIISLSIILLLSYNNAQCEGDNPQDEKNKETTQLAPLLISDTIFAFNYNEVGDIPMGWSQYHTGKGKSVYWQVFDDAGRIVMAQFSFENPNYHFNEAVYNGFIVKNVELAVELRGVKGQMDQGGGIIWRFIDADNYYVVRANPLENNVVLYKVENGERVELSLLESYNTNSMDVEDLGIAWNMLGVKVEDNLFTVYLNKKQIYQVSDTTFQNAGKIGLWTKADAITYFDDFQVINIE